MLQAEALSEVYFDSVAEPLDTSVFTVTHLGDIVVELPDALTPTSTDDLEHSTPTGVTVPDDPSSLFEYHNLEEGTDVEYPEIPEDVWGLILQKCKTVARNCSNHSDSAVDADDIAMQAMEGLFKSTSFRKIYADPSKGIQDLTNYASRAVRNTTINHIHAVERRPQQGELLNTDQLHPDRTDPFAESAADGALFNLLKNNPKYNEETGTDFRETFYLMRICGLSGPEIAKRLNISVKTVSTRVSRYEKHIRPAAIQSGLYGEIAGHE